MVMVWGGDVGEDNMATHSTSLTYRSFLAFGFLSLRLLTPHRREKSPSAATTSCRGLVGRGCDGALGYVVITLHG